VILVIVKKLFLRELRVPLDKYRGFDIKYIGGGFQLYEGDFLKETHACLDNDEEKRLKSRQRIDSIHRYRRLEDDRNIDRVDAEVKLARDNGC
jgi:hypothetical protein